ncbi:MAG TPA: phosphoglucosamine mutase [Terriglobia bacterium]|nr:phosphoglucosamine mutase [Terriglobia bacterium]
MNGMPDKPQLFGTDGVRGVAGEYPLDRATVWKFGCAIGRVLEEEARTAGATAAGGVRVVLGRDTRESGDGLARLIASGLGAAGVEVSYADVITTPGIAFLARHHAFAAGIVISASHNPYRDNGVKALSKAGTKLPEEMELRIERELDTIEPPQANSADSAQPALADRRPELAEDYLRYLEGLARDLEGISRLRLVMDCANGAASGLGPELMRRLDVNTQVLNTAPDGRNINLGCGSLFPHTMAKTTRDLAADLGVAFDGDADRAIFATRSGRIADGDHVLYAAAGFLQDRGALRGGAVVGSQMTNFALERALERRGIALKRAPVGDRYVLEEMLRSGINLGGEPSGHIIFRDRGLAGDGLVTLLEVLRIVSETGRSLEELLRGYAPLPQLIVNVRVRTKPPLESIPAVADAIERSRRDIDHEGRVVVRYSGTEALARVMVEAKDGDLVRRHADGIAEAIEREIGAGPA